jgi:hypothetical protein
MILAGVGVIQARFRVKGVAAVKNFVLEGAGPLDFGPRGGVAEVRLAVGIVEVPLGDRARGPIHHGRRVPVGIVGVVEGVVAFLRAAIVIAVGVAVMEPHDRGLGVPHVPDVLVEGMLHAAPPRLISLSVIRSYGI